MERCSRDGRSASELDEDAAGRREVGGGNVIVRSGVDGPCRARMGSGVPSCETCTPSYARCGNSLEDEDEDADADEGGDFTHMSVLRYRADDASVEGWAVSGDTTGACLYARPCALRSTPSTILEPDGRWVA